MSARVSDRRCRAHSAGVKLAAESRRLIAYSAISGCVDLFRVRPVIDVALDGGDGAGADRWRDTGLSWRWEAPTCACCSEGVLADYHLPPGGCPHSGLCATSRYGECDER
jgi:hypothetical protein